MRTKTVLVVDDERSIRFSLKRSLEGQGYRVLGAANALQALVLCACNPVDLVLTEMELPGISGPQLAEAVSGAFPALPVLYMSARHERSNGAPFLPKPVEPEALIEKVRLLLDAPPKKQPEVEISARDACAPRAGNGV